IARLESLLPGALKRLQHGPADRQNDIGNILDNLADYRRQYIGVVTPAGSRRVLLNNSPGGQHGPYDSPDDWQYVVDVEDGGYWHWRIQFDVESEEFVEFNSNGYA
ncbi:MAG TPA: hypothetical protein VK824_05710, partial [Planctomycetota bacterium]|nr:hypothetical protein [Planctomycetota bacterium]